MTYKRHLKHNHSAAIVFSLIVLVVVLGLGTLIADRQRSKLELLAEDIRSEGLDINLAAVLHERRVLSLTDDSPTLEKAYDALISESAYPTYLFKLDAYLQASRVVNSMFRKAPGAARKILALQDQRNALVPTHTDEPVNEPETSPPTADTSVPGIPPAQSATRDFIPIPWHVVFFGYEQYVCFFLAALCLGELYTIRRRLRAEEKLADATLSAFEMNDPGDKEIDATSAKTVIHQFNTVSGKLIYRTESLDEAKLQKMQRFAWIAMVNSMLDVFRRTGDRLQSLEAATSAHESAQTRFDGNFHFEQYLQWAIPSIGFLGTIRGIAAAMGAAQVADDLPIVVSYLGVAFYSTLTALVLNLLLMGVRAMTLNRADFVFAHLDEVLRRDAVPRLATRALSAVAARPAAREE